MAETSRLFRSESDTTDEARVRTNLDLDDLGLLRRAEEGEGSLTGRAPGVIGREDLDLAGKVGMTGSPGTLFSRLLSSLAFCRVRLLEGHHLPDLAG